MLTRFSDFDRSFDVFEDFRKQMDRVFGDLDERWGYARPVRHALAATSELRVDVVDAGSEIRLSADVPGLTDKDLEVMVHDGSVTISGERKTSAPEGYAWQRQEREAFRFRKTFALPVKVDVERSAATVKDGVLEVRMAKAAEVCPKQIRVQSAS